MTILTLQRHAQYGAPSKEHPPDSLKTGCRKTFLNIFPWEFDRVSIVVNV